MHFSPVDQQQIRQRRKLFVSFQAALKPTLNRLIHARIVVLHIQAADAEFPVIAAERFSVLKNGHCRNNPAVPQVRHIKRLNPPRKRLQFQCPLQPLQRLAAPLFGSRSAFNFFLCVQLGAFDQTQTLPASGNFHMHPFVRDLTDQFLQILRPVDLTGQQNRLRNAASRSRIVLPDQPFHRFAVALDRLVQHFDVLADEIAFHEVQNRKAALRSAPESDGIGVRKGGGNDTLPVPQTFDSPDAVAQFTRALKTQFLGSRKHFLLQIRDQLLALSLQNHRRLLNPCPVISGIGIPQTPAGTFFQMIVQTGPFLSDVPREGARTVRQQQCLRYGIDDFPALTAPAEGAEILRPVLCCPGTDFHSGIFFPAVHPDKGITLVVLEQDVIVGLMPFDQ